MVARFLAWRRYRRELARLVAAHHARGYRLTPWAYRQLRRQARETGVNHC
jgi:hypothetical protein